MGGTQNVSFLGRRYFKLPILSCPRIPPATQASYMHAYHVYIGPKFGSDIELKQLAFKWHCTFRMYPTLLLYSSLMPDSFTCQGGSVATQWFNQTICPCIF